MKTKTKKTERAGCFWVILIDATLVILGWLLIGSIVNLIIS